MTTIRIQALPKFPASVEAGDGIVITRSNGVFTFSIDPNIADTLGVAMVEGGNTFAGRQIINAGVGDGLQLFSGSAGTNSNIDIGRTGIDMQIGVVGHAGDFFSATVAGETVVRSAGGSALWLGGQSSTPGIKIANNGTLTFPQHVSGYLNTNDSGALTVTALGTAALKDTGTSGNKVPLLDGANIFSAAQIINAGTFNGLSVFSNSASISSYISLGRNAGQEAQYGIAGATNAFFTGTVASDVILRSAGGGVLWIGGSGATGVGIKMSNAGALTFPQHVSGMLAVNGSGVVSATTNTGSGNNVLATAPTITTINLSGGQIAFPATQSASGDPNTLDDYEEGTWTPVLTFATPGNLSVSYSVQAGTYTKVGRKVTALFSIATSAFTHTTAAGSLLFTGLPFTVLAGTSAVAGVIWGGITKAGYTNVNARALGSGMQIDFLASGSGVSVSTVTAADTPSGGNILMTGEVVFFV